MNTNRCRKFLIAACLISLSTSAWAQITKPELGLGTGFEPVVNADRDTGSSGEKRVQFLWMMANDTSFQINRRITHDLGANWLTATPFIDNKARIDPFAACNVGGTTDPRHMYLGWYSEIGNPSGTHFLRSLGGDEVDHEVVAQSDGTDRPWLVANSASLYLSYNVNSLPYAKQTLIPPGEQEVTWPGSPVPVGTPAGGTSFVGHFPVATYLDSIGAERTFVLVRQHRTNGIGQFDNSARVYRSTDLGQSWKGTDVAGLEGADGFPEERDLRMVPFHISCDPMDTTGRIYAFYVRNEVTPFPTGPPKRNVLYSRASYDGGDTWSGESRVYTLSNFPATGFADVPPNGAAGFYRIGRVWSAVAPNGRVYVIWMDNRYGRYTTTKDYWHVFYSWSSDFGQTWTAPVRVSGPDTNDLTVIKANASIGGFGNPLVVADHLPPGDFASCDADSLNLYVAWPDSRLAQTTGRNSDTKAYFRRIFP